MFKHNIIVVILISIFTNSTALISGYFGWDVQLIITSIVFFVVGLLYIRCKLKLLFYATVLLLPFTVIYLPVVIVDKLIHVYPIALIPYISFTVGVVFQKLNKLMFRLILIVPYFIIIIISFWSLYPNYRTYVFNRNNISLEGSYYDISKLIIYSKNNQKINIKLENDEIIVFDFWSTTCGVCYKKFPKFESLKSKYSSNKEVKFYAVGLCNKNQSHSDVIEKSKALDYSFDFIFLKNDSISNDFIKKYIHSVPTLMILNKNSIEFIGGSDSYNSGIHNIENKLNNFLLDIKR